MTKLMTWSLHAQDSAKFNSYMKLAAGEPWYSNNYELVNENGMAGWDVQKRTFVEMIQKYPEKFYSIGMHEFGVNEEGKVYDMGWGTHAFDKVILNSTLTDVVTSNAVKQSLRYLMHNYSEIEWALQFLCTTNSVGARVEPVLDNRVNADGSKAQDNFINHAKNIARIYTQHFPMIKTIEIDFEKTTSRNGFETGNNGVPDHIKFKNLLTRIKNEVCIPYGLKLRVNIFAMTDDFIPNYYSWHDYRTLASAKDSNGNQAINEFQLMSYDFSWGGSAPGPSTPLWWLKKVLDHVKKLNDDGIWKSNDVFIGNAGYGRRWPLGEVTASGASRMGVTMDYKSLMYAQNGNYIHNPGMSTTYEGVYGYWFNNQDFIPLAGFNDEESDYQRTFFGVYDRFNLKPDGGSIVAPVGGNYINQPSGAPYVTNYSRRQFPIFSGVQAIAASASVSGRFAKYESNSDGDIRFYPKRAIGISTTQPYIGYEAYPQFNPIGWVEGDVVKPVDAEGRIVYNFSASGSAKLIAAVRYPFFDQAQIKDIYLNGTEEAIDGPYTDGTRLLIDGKYDWNPFMQAQETHFVDLGTYNFSGSNTIAIGNTEGAVIYGFIVCSSFDYNLRGGEVTFPTSLQPMQRRDVIEPKLLPNGDKNPKAGIVTLKQAQYPEFVRLVGEILPRAPRPAIIWEDIFSSYVKKAAPGTPVSITQYPYYRKNNATIKGFTIGDWPVFNGGTADYDHLYNDSRATTNVFMLNHRLSSAIAVDVELKGSSLDVNAVYGIRILADSIAGTDGYNCVLDYGTRTVKIIRQSDDAVLANQAMTSSLIGLHGSRIRLRVYVLDNAISFVVGKKMYFHMSILGLPNTGAYGIYNKDNRMTVYKYNISSLERWERMEKIEVIIGGNIYYFDEISRKSDTVFDEYGFIVKKCYPLEIPEEIPDMQNPDGSTVVESDMPPVETIAIVQTNPNYAWGNDYKNKNLVQHKSLIQKIPAWGEYVNGKWEGKQDVIIRFRDAGIWFKNFYVGDDEGMSVAYNSDRIGFVKTANLVNDYGCKGIALWTLGQEDPTIYSYISG